MRQSSTNQSLRLIRKHVFCACALFRNFTKCVPRFTDLFLHSMICFCNVLNAFKNCSTQEKEGMCVNSFKNTSIQWQLSKFGSMISVGVINLDFPSVNSSDWFMELCLITILKLCFLTHASFACPNPHSQTHTPKLLTDSSNWLQAWMRDRWVCEKRICIWWLLSVHFEEEKQCFFLAHFLFVCRMGSPRFCFHPPDLHDCHTKVSVFAFLHPSKGKDSEVTRLSPRAACNQWCIVCVLHSCMQCDIPQKIASKFFRFDD